jgi:hypothetical protein
MLYAIIIFVQVILGMGDISKDEQTYVWIGLVGFCSLVSILTLVLFCTLSCNVCGGVTTNEARLGRNENENDRGCCKNFTDMFLTTKRSQITY